MVHAYKYNGWLYRTVEFPVVIRKEVDFILLYLKKKNTITIKNQENSKKSTYYRHEFSKFWLFLTNAWFNVVINIFPDDYSFYVNIASPYIIEENALKYIDFDIDFKIASNNVYQIIDQEEYLQNSRKWSYSPKTQNCIEQAKKEVLKLIKQHWFQMFFEQNPDFNKNKKI